MHYEDKVLEWNRDINDLILDMVKESLGGDVDIVLDFKNFILEYEKLTEEIGKIKRKRGDYVRKHVQSRPKNLHKRRYEGIRPYL